MFLIIWLFIGAVTMAFWLNNKWKKGEDITIEDLWVAALCTLGGLMSAVIAIITILENNKTKVMIKGKPEE